jgi:hypothetical protein
MTEASDMPLTPGNTLFEYRITRALGQGAFGTVYLRRTPSSTVPSANA